MVSTERPIAGLKTWFQYWWWTDRDPFHPSIRTRMRFLRQPTHEKIIYNYMNFIENGGAVECESGSGDPFAGEKYDSWVHYLISTLILGYCSDIRLPYSIVAVHGLGANPDWAWTRKRVLRDEDMVPSKILHARNMTFNYQSKWHKDAPRKDDALRWSITPRIG